MSQKKHTCKQCPFHVLNWNKFKPDIYEDVKAKSSGSLHRCHIIGDVCNGFVKEGMDREDRDVIVLAEEFDLTTTGASAP
jgi:hypothetical protein